LIDLLTSQEHAADAASGRFRFDVQLLADRLVQIIDWLELNADTRILPIILFGASTGAAAALLAAVRRPQDVQAVVSRGGRPDLAGDFLKEVHSPTLFIVGSRDPTVLALNSRALQELGSSQKILEIVPGAGHLFEEPGTLERVAQLACAWLLQHGTWDTEEPKAKAGHHVASLQRGEGGRKSWRQ
jgi:pimeloyl-ACP methyl ester carboxylesterase